MAASLTSGGGSGGSGVQPTQLLALSFQPTQHCWYSCSYPFNTAGTRTPTNSILRAITLNPLITAGTCAPTHSTLLALSSRHTQHCWHSLSSLLNCLHSRSEPTLMSLSLKPTQQLWYSCSNPSTLLALSRQPTNCSNLLNTVGSLAPNH